MKLLKSKCGVPKSERIWQRYSLSLIFKVVDCDGDKLLVIKDRLLTKIAKRNMQGIVPLYYEMKKAKGGLLSPQSMYEGMIKAYTTGNIGPISNRISVVHNSVDRVGEEQLNVVKWLCMENNYVIDAAKTLFTPTRPKEIDNIIKQYTKLKLPNFFIYAKDKTQSQVEPPNNSTMNRIMKSIPSSRIKFSKTVGKFDYRVLMNQSSDFTIAQNNPIVNSYDYWNSRQGMFCAPSGHTNDEDLYKYREIRNKIIEDSKSFGADIDYIVNTLVMYLYTVRTNSAKKTLWACFGKEIYENIVRNLKEIGPSKICPICGKRFVPNNAKQSFCSHDCYYENKKRKLRISCQQ